MFSIFFECFKIYGFYVNVKRFGKVWSEVRRCFIF